MEKPAALGAGAQPAEGCTAFSGFAGDVRFADAKQEARHEFLRAGADVSTPSSRRALSPRAMTVFAIAVAITFSASSSAPTPLYRLYQEGFGLSPLTVTVIFASYAFSLLAALLTVGSLSDYIGRRPVIFAALALNAAAMIVFVNAHSAATLIVARVVQGFATGAATTTLGAAILDTDRARGPLYNSITAFIGLTLGTLGSGALVTFAPAPTQLVYAILLAASVSQVLILRQMPETAQRRAGAVASLRPQMRVPVRARRAFMRVTPVNVAAWALGGFYFSLMPSLVRMVTGVASPLLGGIVVATLTSTALAVVLAFRNRPVDKILGTGTAALIAGVAITLVGVDMRQAPTLLLGAAVAGAGFGATFSGILRTILPLAGPEERAALLSTFYVESYIAFSVPAILVGLLIPFLGLIASAYFYGAAIIMLATLPLLAAQVARTMRGTKLV